MMIDARAVDDGAEVQADIAIVGGGPAGLSIAHALIGRQQKVVLLEGGGLGYDADDQALHDGGTVGLDYYPLDSARLRYRGGSTNDWGGWCTPYRDRALAPWPSIPGSGWPIRWVEIEPYGQRAAALDGRMPDGLGQHVSAVARHLDDMLGLAWRTLKHGQLPVHELLLRPCVPPAPEPRQPRHAG